MGRRTRTDAGRPKSKGQSPRVRRPSPILLPAEDGELRSLREKVQDLRHLVQRSTWRHSALFELAPTGYLLLDGKGLIVEMNLAMSVMIARPRKLVSGTPLVSLVNHADHPAFMDHMRRCRESAGGSVVTKLRLVGPLGDIDVSLISRATHAASDPARAFMTAVIDNTQLRRAEEALEQTEHKLREMNAELVRRVLEAENATAQLRILAGRISSAEQQERRRVAALLHDHVQQFLVSAKIHLRICAHATDDLPQRLQRVESSIDQAIEASRTLTLELSPPVLHDAGLAAALNWLVRWMADKHRLKVHLDVSVPEEPDDAALKSYLFEAVRELLLNVVKHARVQEAQVLVQRTVNRMEVVVSDEGAGFDVAAYHSSMQREHVGIMTLRERAQLLGGLFEMRSSPGKGTTVRLMCPLSPPGPKPAAARGGQLPVRSVPAGGANGIRVLIVDDHHFLREGLVRVMQDEGIDVVGESADGRDAVLKARDLAPDVVVMDVTLPVLGGIEATRIIRSENPAVSVIGLSMHEKKDMENGMLAAGAAAYLTKGIPVEQLIEKVREVAASARREAPPDGADRSSPRKKGGTSS